MGKHLLLEVHKVDFNLLNDINPLLEVVLGAIGRSKMTVLNTYYHKFDPQGLTILVCLAESHVSLHTFPEHNCVSCDAYTCGEGNPKLIVLELLKYFNSDDYTLREITR